MLLSLASASAQYYDTGASPAWVRWQTIESDSVRVIAPTFFSTAARSVLFYADSTRSSVDYGLGYGVDKAPLVIHPATSLSNGLSIWAPRRVEMSGMPGVEGYATSWLRQLSVHEMRHSAQYAALDRNFVHGLYYLLGEQGLLLASGLMPFWWLEGDATDAETQHSSFGRGLQPSFTMHYRAVGRDILDGNIDRWFGGSYTMEVPSHYELGYQLVSTANTLADRYVWDEVVEFATRRPYTIFATEIAMRRKLGYSTTELFHKTFERLNDHWDSLPERNDSATRLDGPTPDDQYISYQYPLWADNNTIIALKTTLDKPSTFVALDAATGAERTLFSVGYVSSRPAIIENKIYWTEHTQHSSFGQDVGSVLWCRPLDGGPKSNPISRKIVCLYPTDHNGSLAYVRYNYEGTYTVVCPEGEWTAPEGVEIHGLAADEGWLYLLTTGYGGMAIERLRPADMHHEVVKPASHSTLSHLVAQGGKLYFGSIASGYDEVHSWDLATATEERITTSQYGSFWGTPSPDGERLALATYDRTGYHPAVAANEGVEVVEQTYLPQNVVNPPSYEWSGVVKVDRLNFSATDLVKSKAQHPAKPYRKAAHLLNIHSWAPIYFRPEEVMAGSVGDVGLGLMATSQNLLNTAFTTFGYRYKLNGTHSLSVNYKYVGLPVKMEIGVNHDTGAVGMFPLQGMIMENGTYSGIYDHTEQVKQPTPPRGYTSLYLRGSVPFVLSHSYWTSVLTPSVEISANNNLVYNPDRYTGGTYHSGMVASAATLQWNSYTRQAKRNLQPRWGVSFIAGVGKSLTAKVETPTTLGLFGRIYTPGFGLNDSFTIRASYQNVEGNGPLNYAVNLGWLTPRGSTHFDDTRALPDNQVGASVEYITPLCYPEVGIEGIVLLKQVSLSLFGDLLVAGANYKVGGYMYKGPWSVGANLMADTSWLRLPSQGDLSLRASCYFVSGHLGRPVLSAGASVAF